jgi:branched-subunit amino acid ABC-type transport system permease component
VLRPLVNQPDIILFMATIGITLFLVGFGEIVFGGENKVMITEQLGIPTGSFEFEPFGGFVSIEQKDLTAVVGAILLVVGLLLFLNKSKMGRAIRALGDDHQAALSVGISLSTIWVLVWFIAGVIALATGIVWGARAGVSFALEVIAFKALPVLMLGGLESVSGAIIGGLMIGILEKLFEIYWGQPLLGGNTETWFAFVFALIVLLFRPQGLFGEKHHRAGVSHGSRPVLRIKGGDHALQSPHLSIGEMISPLEGEMPAGQRGVIPIKWPEDMLYRTAGQFKTSYAADHALFPVGRTRGCWRHPARLPSSSSR